MVSRKVYGGPKLNGLNGMLPLPVKKDLSVEH